MLKRSHYYAGMYACTSCIIAYIFHKTIPEPYMVMSLKLKYHAYHYPFASQPSQIIKLIEEYHLIAGRNLSHSPDSKVL